MKPVHLFILQIAIIVCSCGQIKQGKNLAKGTGTDTLPILGIDVSHYQGDIDWQEVKRANLSYMYAKVTQGADYHDHDFNENWQNAKANGLYRGAYHFFISNEDPVKQANYFLAHLDKYEKGDLPPVLDIEESSIVGKVDLGTFHEDIHKWLKTVERKLGVRPIIYTDPSFGNKYLNDTKFGEYKLWVADYKVSEPALPGAWKNKGWIFWQRADIGLIEGISGNVDHDLFNGNKEEFLKILMR